MYICTHINMHIYIHIYQADQHFISDIWQSFQKAFLVTKTLLFTCI